jgi:predicted regulator of Ras-like GTPase activity (Roadblock/LC7/MglB family)
MEIKTLTNLLNKPFNDIKPYYIGIFVKGKTVASKYIKKSEKLEDLFSRMAERSLEINTAIKNFNAEFLFSEGKDFSIIIYYITTEIAIGIIHIEKSNFSLLKITAKDLARELKKYEKDLCYIMKNI